MNNRALLVLEAPWYYDKALSVRRLYQRLTQGQIQSFLPAQNLLQLQKFSQQDGILVLSGHGKIQNNQRLIHTSQGYLNICHYLQQLKTPLTKTILILDACYIGKQPEQLRAALGLKAVLGFSKQVNWQASSILIQALLQRWQYSHHSQHDIDSLQQMIQGEYLYLMQELGVVWAYKI